MNLPFIPKQKPVARDEARDALEIATRKAQILSIEFYIQRIKQPRYHLIDIRDACDAIEQHQKRIEELQNK